MALGAALTAQLAELGYVGSSEIAVALELSERLGKPLLIEGPPGVGKTELAKLWAKVRDVPLVRLQCYEGLDETKALYEWAYGKQILYAQLLKERAAELLGGAASLSDGLERLDRAGVASFFDRRFLLRRPLLEALERAPDVVLLIDEVDRADAEFEAFLLEALAEYQVTIPELGTVRADGPPRVVLTSNDTRPLAGALRRRCLYLHLDYPDADRELAILRARVPELEPELAARVVAWVQRLRDAHLERAPGVSEAIDWALALLAVGAVELDEPTLRETLGALLKDRGDVLRVLEQRRSFG